MDKLAQLKIFARRLQAHALQALDRARFDGPLLNPIERRAVQTLEEIGVFVTSLNELGIPFNETMEEELRTLIPEIDAAPKKPGERKLFARVSSPEIIDRCPRVISFGLEETLLNIVEGYLRMQVHYRGVLARIDDADGESGETRCWHMDAEDFRVAKAIVYLNDVLFRSGCVRLGP